MYLPGTYYCGVCGARLKATGVQHLVCKRCRLREILEFCLLVSIPMIGLAIIVAYTLIAQP